MCTCSRCQGTETQGNHTPLSPASSSWPKYRGVWGSAPAISARMTPAAWLLALPVRAYRLLLSPWVGHSCRFQPTCSAYALEALETHGALYGGWLTLRRLARCHPWGSSGYDPVPPRKP